MRKGPLSEILRLQGEWIFRRRGYLPALFIPLIFFAIYENSSTEVFKVRSLYLEISSYSVSVLGILIRAFTVGFIQTGTSGRGKSQKATVLNTDGPYSVTRNPLYLGNFFCMLGVIILCEHLWLLFTFILSFFLYYERVIIAEEAYLRSRFGKDYEIYAQRTPAFIPDFRLWRRPKNPFSIRRVLRREYPSFLLVTGAFFALTHIKYFARYGEIRLDPKWGLLFFTSVIICLGIWFLKKFTPYLRERSL